MIQQYEILKASWIANHPRHTPEEYERAIMAICDRLGI